MSSSESTIIRLTLKNTIETNCNRNRPIRNFTNIPIFFRRIFTVSPDMQQVFKFAKNKTLKQLETSPRLAIHASKRNERHQTGINYKSSLKQGSPRACGDDQSRIHTGVIMAACQNENI